jgi:hypothetical protein
LYRRGGNQPGNLAVGIIKVAKLHRVGWAGLYTDWKETLLKAPLTEITLLHDVIPGAHKAHVIRTGGHAITASDTPVGVDHHNPILGPLIGRPYRTNRGANRPFAVVANQGKESFTHIGVAPFLNLFHPRPKAPQGNFEFRLAGQGAGVTADAATEVDQHGITFFHHNFPFRKIHITIHSK